MYDKEPKLYSEISDFDFLSVSFDFLHEITLFTIDIPKKGSTTPFLTL